MCFYVNNYAIHYSEQLTYRHSHILVEFVTYLVTVKINALLLLLLLLNTTYFHILLFTFIQ
jgi:hypothetical protein